MKNLVVTLNAEVWIWLLIQVPVHLILVFKLDFK